MDSFEERLDEIFMEGKWDTLKAIGLGSLVGGVGAIGAGDLSTSNVKKPEVPSHTQVDINKQEQPSLKKIEPIAPKKEAPKYEISETDIKKIASTLVLEAGGETDPTSMVSIMNVIHNRSSSPKDYVKVCFAKKQFSCHNGKTPEQSVTRASKHPKFAEAVDIVQRALSHKLNDVTGGATHYHVYKGQSAVKPSWTHPDLGGNAYIDGKNRGVKITKYIGDHVFLKDVNKVLAKN